MGVSIKYSYMEPDEITGIIVDASVRIHTEIGPGCFERVYEELLNYELTKAGLNLTRQVPMPIAYAAMRIENAYRLDLLVENKIIVEIKSIEFLMPVHFKQLRTYLRLLGIKHGILLNFKVNLMKEGVHRVFYNEGR
jgi:GxxExxY protein